MGGVGQQVKLKWYLIMRPNAVLLLNHKWGLRFEGSPGNEAAGFLWSIKNIVMPTINLLVILSYYSSY